MIVSKMNWKHKLIPKGKLLDIGCQHGKLRSIVNPDDYFGLDIDIEYAGKWDKGHFKLADIRKRLPYKDNSFDIIYCNHVFEHINEDEQAFFIKECYRILRHKGIILLFTPTPYHPYFFDHPQHKRASTHGSLITLLTKHHDFHLIECKYGDARWIPQRLQSIWRAFFKSRDVYIIAVKFSD